MIRFSKPEASFVAAVAHARSAAAARWCEHRATQRGDGGVVTAVPGCWAWSGFERLLVGAAGGVACVRDVRLVGAVGLARVEGEDVLAEVVRALGVPSVLRAE